MPLSLQTQWTLVASGIVAHADHVLAGEECERLMALVDQEVDGDEYAQWMATISDPKQLQTLLEGLALPPPETYREILEDAWLMAVMDGERAEVELEALRGIAERLGVESFQLDAWREAWTRDQSDYSDVAVACLAWILDAGEPWSPEDRAVVNDFVHTLPATHEHRESLVVACGVARRKDEVDQQVQALGRAWRRDLVRRLFEAASRANRADQALARFREVAAGLGMSVKDIEQIASD